MVVSVGTMKKKRYNRKIAPATPAIGVFNNKNKYLKRWRKFLRCARICPACARNAKEKAVL